MDFISLNQGASHEQPPRMDLRALPRHEHRADDLGRPHAAPQRPHLSDRRLRRPRCARRFGQSPAGRRLLLDQHRLCDAGPALWRQAPHPHPRHRIPQHQDRPGAGGARSDALLQPGGIRPDAASCGCAQWQSAGEPTDHAAAGGKRETVMRGTLMINPRPRRARCAAMRRADFILPIGLIALAISAGTIEPPWVWMWTLAGAVYFGCKWIMWRRAGQVRRHAPAWRSWAFFFAWPGMNAREFLDVRASPAKPPSSEWIAASAKIGIGAVILWIVCPRILDWLPAQTSSA